MLECHVGAVDVVAGRQPGFEKQHRAMGLGQLHTVQRDRDVAVRPQRIHPCIRVSRMAEDRLVLLEPVQRVPSEPDQSGESAVVEYPGRRMAVPQNIGADIRKRNVVLRVVRQLPHVARRGRVEDQLRLRQSRGSALEPVRCDREPRPSGDSRVPAARDVVIAVCRCLDAWLSAGDAVRNEIVTHPAATADASFSGPEERSPDRPQFRVPC